MRLACLGLLVATALCAQTARDLKLERSTNTLPDKRERWALLVGVSSYKYAPPAAQLRYAHRDADEFAQFLRSESGGSLAGSHLRVLTDEKATLASVKAALHNWLPRVVGANDIVYIFFAGHAVIGERQQSYFVAHDSDPQNLHATALAFSEVNDVLSRKLKASLVVLFADACHAGGIGWTADPKSLSRAHGPIEALGAQDRAVMKLLASRPSERSYEDERWGGGHGVFTYSVLNGLRGAAERDKDGVVRAAELIEYVSRTVPQQTGSQQTPRIAGNFEGNLPLSVLHSAAAMIGPQPSSLKVVARPGTAVYVGSQFRGAVRTNGELLVEGLSQGSHRVSFDVPGMNTLELAMHLAGGLTVADVEKLPEFQALRLQTLIREGKVLGTGGALEFHKVLTAEQRTATEPLIVEALEETGNACVSDYVQSTAGGLKRAMFLRAADAFRQLQAYRPEEKALEAKALFCGARAEIAAGNFAPAIEGLKKSLAIEPEFACSYNALGVAYTRLNQAAEARRAFEKARELAPEWALPSLDIARQHLAAGDVRGAVPHLEQAVRLFPAASGLRWTLARAYRVLGQGPEFLREAEAVVKLDPNYAPVYSELGAYYESIREFAQAARHYDTYLLLAPNYADSADVRGRAQKARAALVPRPAPSLQRSGERRRVE